MFLFFVCSDRIGIACSSFTLAGANIYRRSDSFSSLGDTQAGEAQRCAEYCFILISNGMHKEIFFSWSACTLRHRSVPVHPSPLGGFPETCLESPLLIGVLVLKIKMVLAR